MAAEQLRVITGEERHFLHVINSITPYSTEEEIRHAIGMLFCGNDTDGSDENAHAERERIRQAQMGRVYIGRQAILKPERRYAYTRIPGLLPTHIVDMHLPSLDDRTWRPARYVGAAFVWASEQQNWQDRIANTVPRYFGERMEEQFEIAKATATYTNAALASQLYPNVLELPRGTVIGVLPEHIPIATDHEQKAMDLSAQFHAHIHDVLQPIIADCMWRIAEIQESWTRWFSAWRVLRMEEMLHTARGVIRDADAAHVSTQLTVFGRALGEVHADEISATFPRCAFRPVLETTQHIQASARALLKT